MGCGSCGTKDGIPKGCNNNGSCGTGSDGCGKLSVFDWLSNMRLPNGQIGFNCVEVRFKNDRKQFYINAENLSLSIGDVVAVEVGPGHDVGIVTMAGELVRIQMKKKNISPDSEEVKRVFRKANDKDIEIWHKFREKEKQVMIDARILAAKLNLEMKICDVEYQGDGSKIIFYYTAESRVDFRQLIKEYAARFQARIEMKQIGYRQEAAKVGGIGSCGRELCCSTWLTDFRSVSTAAARYQQLSINSLKLAGQCGKLKCCLNFELDSYLDALNDFPSAETKFDTVNGRVHCVKTDVFKREMWFAYDRGSMLWYKLTVDQVLECVESSRKGTPCESLEDLSKIEILDTKPAYTDFVEENSLERFERKNNNRRRNNKRTPQGGTDNKSKPDNRNASSNNNNQVNRKTDQKKPVNTNTPNQNKNQNNPSNKKPRTGNVKTAGTEKTGNADAPNKNQQRNKNYRKKRNNNNNRGDQKSDNN